MSLPAMVGHLHYLWWWAVDYAEDGDVSRFEDLDLAIGARWEGNAREFVETLALVGFVDQDGHGRRCIHDWHDYAGKLIERRKANAERMRKARAVDEPGTKNDRAQHVQGTQRARVERPNRTVPNQTLPLNGVPSEPAPLAPHPDHPDSGILNENDGRVYALVDAYAEATKRRANQIRGRDRKEAADALRPLVGDVAPADIIACGDYLRSDPFWQGPGKLTPRVLARTLPEWIAGGKPTAVDARASPAANGTGKSARARAEMDAFLDIAGIKRE